MPASPRPPADEGQSDPPVGVFQEAAECSGAGIDLRGSNGGKAISLVAAPACTRCRRVTPAIFVHCCSEVRRSLGVGQSDLCVHGQVLRVSAGGEFLVIAPAHRVSRFVHLLEGLGELKEAAASRAAERALIERTLRSLVEATEAKHPLTRGHSDRVQIMSAILGERIGLDQETRADLSWAALLHDLGKIGSPDHILDKHGVLTGKEVEVMKEHPSNGEKFLEPLVWLERARRGIRHHHERFDGQGYPDHLAGEQIPLISRVIAVADLFDTMTSRQDAADSATEAATDGVAALERAAGSELDPSLVHSFVTHLDPIRHALLTAGVPAEGAPQPESWREAA